MSTTVASLAEVSRARLFLRTIGAYGSTNQMLLAIVAFLRVTGRDTSKEVVASARLLLYRTVYRPLPPGPYGGPGALNAKLRAEAAAYKLLVTAARNDHAEEFLIGIAMSNWSPTHFGGWSPAGIDSAKNRLFQTYGSFTGMENPPPRPPKAPPPRKELPKLPRDLAYIKPTHSYLDPYAAGSLYQGRHRAIDTEPRRR